MTTPVTSPALAVSLFDGAEDLVARLHSAERARQVRRHIEYDPAPPV